MGTADNIQLTDEKETLFIPLYGKALDYRSKKPILNDSTANEIVEKVGINLAKHKRFGSQGLAVRAKQYDEWAKEFIAKNTNAIVIHLGCGLDARIIRVQPSSSVTWYDVDYPEVIALRKKFYSESNKYKMIASSITAPNWFETISNNRPALIIAEGVFEYVSKEEVKALLKRLTDYLPCGQIAFDVMNPAAKDAGNKRLKKTIGATAILKWAVDDINEVDKFNSRLKRMEVVPLFDLAFVKQLPFRLRVILGLLSISSKRKNGMRLLRYNF